MVANRILTTHVGSLVRPPKLVEFLHKIEDRQPYDQTAYEACLKESIEQVVRQQADAGIDIVSDGEFSKGRNWAFYVHDRLTGVTTRSLTADEAKDPMASAGAARTASRSPNSTPNTTGFPASASGSARVLWSTAPLTYSDIQVKRDIANLKAAAAKAKAPGAFLPVVAPASALPTPRTNIIRTSEVCCGRSPTACTRNTRPSSMPASMCRSTTPSCPTCTKRWCRP